MSDPHDPSVLEQQRDRIRSELASIGDLRPGPLREKHMRCGKPTCRCQREDDPGHGPYFLLDRQTGGRKTTRSIPAARVAETRAQVEECQRLRRLTSELIAVSERLCDTRLAEPATDAGKKRLRRLTSELIAVSERLCDTRLAEPADRNSRRRVRRRHPG